MNLKRLFISIAFGLALCLSISASLTASTGWDGRVPENIHAHLLASGAWEQVEKITAVDGAGNDTFGYAVSINGDTAVVGAEGDDANAGAVYIFERNEGGVDNWGQIAKLIAGDDAAGANFGCAVDIRVDTVVVGANGADGSGAAYIFERNEGGAGNWGQVVKLAASGLITGDAFGRAVAVSGDTVVVGAEGHDDNADDAGAAYVFGRNQGGANAWGQVIKLTASDGVEDDAFGCAVDTISDTIAVGARYDDDNGTSSGSVYVFERNEGGADAWGQTAKLIASDGGMYDYFGNAVAISEDAGTIVIGAYEDNDRGDDSGSAYVFDRNGAGTWDQMDKLTASDGAPDDRFGCSVAVSGDIVAIGTRYGDGASYADAGAAYAFSRDYGGVDTWGQTAKLTASDGATSDYFGHALVISGDTIIVGAYGDDDDGSNSGSAYVFVQKAEVDLSIEKTVFPAVAAPGDAITYTLSFFNSGGADASNVLIIDSMPVSVSNTSVTSSGVAIVQREHAHYAWDVPSLGQNEGGFITITGTLDPVLAAGAFRNTATITPTMVTDFEADASNNSAWADVMVLNVAPVADDDGYFTSEDVPLAVPAPGVLLGDSDANGDLLTATLESGPANGTLVLNADGSFVYTPTVNYHGSDHFYYHATDGIHNSTSATVTLTVLEQPLYHVHLPLVLQSMAAPDLVVLSITATTDTIQVVIGNQGNAPAVSDFWVDVYIDPDPVPGTVNQTWLHVADMGLVWDVWDTLYPGQTLTLTNVTAYAEPYSFIVWPLIEGTPVYAQVDSWNGATDYGAVLEDHEILGEPYNNIDHTTVSAMP